MSADQSIRAGDGKALAALQLAEELATERLAACRVANEGYPHRCVGEVRDLQTIRAGLAALAAAPAAAPADLSDEQIEAAVAAWFKEQIQPGRYPFAKRMRAAIGAALAAAPAVSAPAVEPVAKVVSWTSGSYWRNYKLAWMEGSDNLDVGALLYAAPQLQAAPLSDALLKEAAANWHEYGDGPGAEVSRRKAALTAFQAGARFAEQRHGVQAFQAPATAAGSAEA